MYLFFHKRGFCCVFGGVISAVACQIGGDGSWVFSEARALIIILINI